MLTATPVQEVAFGKTKVFIAKATSIAKLEKMRDAAVRTPAFGVVM